MKKIINGRKYDTETARMVGDYSHAYPGDFHWFCETLYCKKNGEYFIHGEGGAMSKYAESCGQNQWSGGESIMPVSYENARQWAEDHLSADEYEDEFGEVSEDEEEDVMLSVRVSSGAKSALDRYCSKTGKGKGEVVSELLAKLA